MCGARSYGRVATGSRARADLVYRMIYPLKYGIGRKIISTSSSNHAGHEQMRAEYERKLQRKMNVNQQQGLYPEMYVCKEGGSKNVASSIKGRPFVVFDGEVYYKNDIYKNGVITDINCEYIRIVSGETEIRVSLYDEGMVEKVEGSRANEAN